MIAGDHVALAGSSAVALSMVTAWHVKCTADAVVNIRKVSSSGPIIVPLNLTAGQSVGEQYANPMQAASWYFEVVSGTVVASMVGRA